MKSLGTGAAAALLSGCSTDIRRHVAKHGPTRQTNFCFADDWGAARIECGNQETIRKRNQRWIDRRFDGVFPAVFNHEPASGVMWKSGNNPETDKPTRWGHRSTFN